MPLTLLFQLFGRFFFYPRGYGICEGAKSVSPDVRVMPSGLITFGPVLDLDAVDIGLLPCLLNWTATAAILLSSMLLYSPGYTQNFFVLTLRMDFKCARFRTIKQPSSILRLSIFGEDQKM